MGISSPYLDTDTTANAEFFRNEGNFVSGGNLNAKFAYKRKWQFITHCGLVKYKYCKTSNIWYTKSPKN